MRHVGHVDVVPLGDLLDPAEHLRQRHPGHADVLGQQRAQPLQRRVGQPPRLEQRVRLLLVGGDHRPAGARLLEALPHPLRLGVALRAGGVDPAQQHHVRVGGEPHVLPRVDRRQAVPVHQFQRRGDDPGRRHRADRLPGVHHRVEVPGDRPLQGTRGAQPHRDLRDDAERPLGADHQPGQVVPGDALGGPAAHPDQLAPAVDHLQLQDVVPGHAVLHTAHAAGVGGDVPADRRPRGAGRVRRVPQALLGADGPQVVVDDARLHHGVPLVGVDAQHLVHVLEGEDHRAVHGVGAAGQAGARAPGDHRHLVLEAEPHHVADLLGGPGTHHGERHAVRRPLGLVVLVAAEGGRVGDDLRGRYAVDWCVRHAVAPP